MAEPGKIYTIGDVHGCRVELEKLLEKLKLGPTDLVIFLGDLVNRGPDSAGVLKIARELPTARSILGNHELRLLDYHRHGDERLLKPYDWETLDQLGGTDWAQMKAFEDRLYFPAVDTLLVHGGLLPDEPWEKQSTEVITQIQSYNPKRKRWGKRREVPGGTTWMKFWKGPPFVVCGHTPRRRVLHKKWSMCIDTACVHGNTLTAYELTTQKLIHVKAEKAYVEKAVPG